MTALAIAEDHPLFRKGLIDLFNSDNSLNVVLEVSNGNELLFGLQHTSVDILLLDLNMPIISGNELIKVLKSRYPYLVIVVITSYPIEVFGKQCLADGVDCYLEKRENSEVIIKTIKEICLAKEIQSKRSDFDFPDEILSEREREILNFICLGKINKEIADLLFISERTVHAHRRSISDKTKTQNIAELFSFAILNGLFKF